MARKPKLENDTLDAGGAGNDTDPIVVVEEDAGDPALLDTGDGNDTANGGGAVEETIETLRAQRDAANARAEREANARQQAEKQLGGAQVQVADTNLLAMNNAIEGFSEAKKGVMAKLRAAKEAGDYDGEIAATDELQQLNGRIQRLNEGKNELERRIEEAKERREQADIDPVEQYIAGSGLNGRAAAWIRQHSDLIVTGSSLDEQKLNNLNYAHAKARKEGHQPGTDGYFEAIEEELLGEEVGEVDHAPQKRQRAPAAPPSRRNDPVLNGGRAPSLPSGVSLTSDGKYRMSADRRDAARISGLSDAEYLTNLLALHKEGALRQLN